MTAPRPFIVAVDGPAGAGKSTTSRRLAARLGFAMVDTGAIYRAVALAASRQGIAFDDDARLGALLPEVRIRFEPPPPGAEAAGQRVLIGDEDVSQAIRTPPMSLGASAVSARPVVRAGLLDLQRRLATAPGNRGRCWRGGTSGRWSSPTPTPSSSSPPRTRSGPGAGSSSSRPRGTRSRSRRCWPTSGSATPNDSSRDVAPLRAAPDAVTVDTGSLSLDDVVERLVALVTSRVATRG